MSRVCLGGYRVETLVVFSLGVCPPLLRTPGFRYTEFNPARFRYRFEVTVEVGTDRYTASAVQEISAFPVNVFGRGAGAKSYWRAQAAWMPIPGGPALFFAAANRGGGSDIAWTFYEACGLDLSASPEDIPRQIDQFNGTCILTEQQAPLIIVAPDVNDPTSFYTVGQK